MTTANNKSDWYRPDIDGLRAIAVIAVIANHLNRQTLPGGYLGVDIFFVISGYVISASLSRENTSSIRTRLVSFYARRMQRLFPNLFVCVLCSCVLVALFNPEPVESIRTGIASLFGVSNFVLQGTSTDYFGLDAELNFLTHTWSLAVEEQFYLIFPVLYLVFGHARSALFKGKYFLLLLSSLTLLSAFLYFRYTIAFPTGNNQTIAFYMIPFRFWELGAGCILYFFEKRYRPSVRINAQVLLAILVTLLFSPTSFSFVSNFAVITVTVFLIYSLKNDCIAKSLLKNPTIVFIGKISYSLYLWHWMVVTLVRWTIGVHWWTIPFQIALIFLLALLAYRYVEVPMRTKRWSTKQGRSIIGVFVVASLSSILLFSWVHHYAPQMYLGETNAVFQKKVRSRVVHEASLLPKDKRLIQKAVRLVEECNVTFSGTFNQGKVVSDVFEKFEKNCLDTPSNKIVLIGDSFARVLSNHIALAAAHIGFDFAMVYSHGCPIPFDSKEILFTTNNDCGIDQRFLSNSIVDSLVENDIVVLRIFSQKTSYIKLSEENLESAVYAYDKEIERFHSLVKGRGAKLLLIGTNGETQACGRSEWFNQLQCPNHIDMTNSIGNRFAVLHNQHLSKIQKRSHNEIEIVDFMTSCSDDRTCPLEEGERRHMTDKEHLSGAAVDKLYPDILAKLKRMSTRLQPP